MSNIDEFVRLMTEKGKKQVKSQIVPAIVEEVDFDKGLMTAKGLLDDLEYFDVILGLGSFQKKPKVGTRCLLGIIANKEAATFLIDAEEVEEMVLISDKSEMTIKEEGFVIKHQDESLTQVLNDFMDEVNKIIVVNGTSINVQAVTAIKERLNTILK